MCIIITPFFLRASLPVGAGKPRSVSESDSLSTLSSLSEAGELGGQGMKKKSKSLLKQMKRKMSFTNTKGC